MATRFFAMTTTGTEMIFATRVERSNRLMAVRQLLAAGIDVRTVRQELTVAEPQVRQKKIRELAQLIHVRA